MADYRFLWLNVALPGCVNDACVFQASHLYCDIARGNSLPDIKKVLTVQSQREVRLWSIKRKMEVALSKK